MKRETVMNQSLSFLLHRPVAVLMTFTACFIVGLVTYFTLPVSLLPDIAIPEITVQVSVPNTSARELENTVVKPLRQQLVQLSRLKDIRSETRDAAAIIRLGFDYGTNTDLAFIEANEKIDAAMNSLPREVNRPQVVKASATDIPVFYLYLTVKEEETASSAVPLSGKFLDLCDFADNVIRRRIEQLPEVAMVDVTGLLKRQLQIVPDPDKMAVMGLTVEDIESALSQNNVELGSMVVRDGYYEYNIKFSTLLRTEEDVRNILIRKEGRIFRLEEFCRTEVVPVREEGVVVNNGKRAVALAVIKQADENMADLKQAVNGVMEQFRRSYPDIEFSISRNQTELLDYTIANLKQNLSLGFLFIFVVAVLFLGDVRSPLVIGICMVVSLVICFLFFYLFGMSLNIISLSGLILALGMMIDSCIIVTENIAQYREGGLTLHRACVTGTVEVVTPMLSSSLTTIAVFVPLIFMSGIAGALFYDQAFAVTVGLLVSYVAGILLLPVLYSLFYRRSENRKRKRKGTETFFLHASLNRFYDSGIDYVFSHKRWVLLFCLLSLPLCVVLFRYIGKERMPQIERNELAVRVEWNENIHLDENRRRVDRLLKGLEDETVERVASVGRQDFQLNRDRALSVSEAELYLRTGRPEEIVPLQQTLARRLREEWPRAIFSFMPPETVFEKLFVTGEADVTAELYARNRDHQPEAEELTQLETELEERTGLRPTGIAFENQLNLCILHERLLLYNVSYNELYRTLKAAFRTNSVGTLHAYQQNLPLSIVGEERTVEEVMRQTLVRTNSGTGGAVEYIPLNQLVKVEPAQDLKTITAGQNGEYIPFSFYDVPDVPELMNRTRACADETQRWDVAFSGSFFTNREMLDELVVILLISILLMYFILAAQFESLVQPLIVLLEVPIDVAFALALLWVCGHTLNLMSAIGLIVTCGIIINDSILKLDAINELRREGMPLFEAIHEAGRRRLRPILMTSLTTIFAMVPLLFSSDMGSELQKPLSIAMIGAMVVGTLVSLFVIPLFYWAIYRKKE